MEHDLSIQKQQKTSNCRWSAAQCLVNVSLVKQPKVIRLAVRADAKQILTDYADETGMAEITLASRIFIWWSSQPEDFQRAVLGLYGKRTPDIARLALEEMARAQGIHGTDAEGETDNGESTGAAREGPKTSVGGAPLKPSRVRGNVPKQKKNASAA